ncbi:MAG: glycosyltransferase family 2 protein [Planctomycetota bacterium]
MIALDVILLLLAAGLLVPSLMLAVEVLASLLPRRTALPDETPRPNVAVIVPAHNEAELLPRTLALLQAGLTDGDRLIVVADNCSDATAQVARDAGAECVERHDTERRGKGYALDAGMQHLQAEGTLPPVVIFNDADVLADAEAIDLLARQVVATGLPAQACYLMAVPESAGRQGMVSRFALVLKNYVRPLGLDRLGVPCPLFGSGMAFPVELATKMSLATGDLVEDMRLGLQLCRDGHGPQFCPRALVQGELPADGAIAASQRRRWEHGHLSVFLATPALLLAGLRRGSLATIVAALDHAVLPLTILAGGILAIVTATTTRILTLEPTTLSMIALATATASIGLLLVAIGLTWLGHLRRQIPASSLLGLPAYVVRRVPNQAAFVFRRQRDWVRTPRAHERLDDAASPNSSAASPN